MTNLTIDVKPHHLFRYPSEWDPRQNGKTKGGYLEGRITLPKDKGNLRVLLSTYPETPHNFNEKIEQETPQAADIHPTLIHVVRKGQGNRRFNDKEPVPNIHHWQQEFVIIDKSVFIRNKTSHMDEQRYDKIAKIPAEEEIFTIKDDMVLPIGKDAGELNMIILIPKTEKRASNEDVSLNKLLKSRVDDPEALQLLTDTYTGKNSLNLKKVKLKVDLFSLESDELLGSDISGAVFDTASKAHGAMDLHDATPLRSCADGGRKIVMIAEFGLAKDVEPRFQLYDSEGKRLKDQEEKLLKQPSDQPGKSVSILKETIVFITPKQPHAEMVMQNRWTIKLVARRSSDGLVSKTKFTFDYVPHDFYSPCIFCEINPDKQTLGHATIAPLRDVARPGLRKRKMSGTEVRDFSDKPDDETVDSPAPASKQRKAIKAGNDAAVSSAFSNSKKLDNLKNMPAVTIPNSFVKILSYPEPPSSESPSFLSIPSSANAIKRSTISALPRIYPKPMENLIYTSLPPIEIIKVESEDEESKSTEAEEPVPFHDFNESQTIRIFPVNLEEQSQASSLIFPTQHSKQHE